jgi:hypothetical protein
MQDVSFRNVEEFLDYLPEHELAIVERLRTIILDSLPHCEERLAYNVPYYYLNARICFIWPSSVPWGKVKKNGVLIGFCQGHLLQDEIQYLEQGTRKFVFTKTFFSIKEIDVEIIQSLIFEAAILDEELAKEKRSKRKKGKK